MAGNNNLAFISCDCCTGKGPLELCEGCIHNRNVITELQRKKRELIYLDENFAAGSTLFAILFFILFIICLFANMSVRINRQSIESSYCSEENNMRVINVKVNLDDGTTTWIRQQINCEK